MCDTVSLRTSVDKSIVSTMQLQCRKTSSSVAGIHGSQDVKTEIVPTAVSENEKSRLLARVQFYVPEKLKSDDQIVEKLLPTSEELAKSELQSKRSSSSSWPKLLQNPSSIRIHEVKR